MAYATIDDLQARWRTLTEAEATRAQVLLDDAAVRIDRKGTVDTGDTLMLEAAKIVSCEMVKRAMNAPVDQPALSQSTMSAGPYSETFSYVNPTGSLYILDKELDLLGFKKQRLGAIRPHVGWFDHDR